MGKRGLTCRSGQIASLSMPLRGQGRPLDSFDVRQQKYALREIRLPYTGHSPGPLVAPSRRRDKAVFQYDEPTARKPTVASGSLDVCLTLDEIAIETLRTEARLIGFK